MVEIHSGANNVYDNVTKEKKTQSSNYSMTYHIAVQYKIFLL